MAPRSPSPRADRSLLPVGARATPPSSPGAAMRGECRRRSVAGLCPASRICRTRRSDSDRCRDECALRNSTRTMSKAARSASACGKLRTRCATIVLSSNLRSQRRAPAAGSSGASIVGPVMACGNRAPRAPQPPDCPTKASGTAHGRQRHRRQRPSQKGDRPGQRFRRTECNGERGAPRK